MALVSCPECSKSVSDITFTMFFIMIVAVGFSFISCAKKTSKDYPIKPVLFTEVQVSDGFWQPRMETNRRVTIPFAFKNSEETGRIDNFAKAGGLMPGEHLVGLSGVDLFWGKPGDAAVPMLGVVPSEEAFEISPRVLEPGEGTGVIRVVLRGFELTFREGVVV